MNSPKFISSSATVAQIVVAVLRVASFSYAVLSLGQNSTNATLLLAVGYLPFIAFFDILVQSFSRISSIRKNYFITAIAPYRAFFAFGSLTVIMAVAVEVFFEPEISRYFIVLCFLLGSVGYIWESWLAIPTRSLAFALIEISFLTSVSLGNYVGYLPLVALIGCFISFPLSRLATLLIPGSPPPERMHSVPISTSASQYIGLSIAQQAVGATSASLPSLYAQASGVFVGLPAQLAWFRVMHAIGAIASLAINALGSRIFYHQAISEVNIIESVIEKIQAYKKFFVTVSFITIILMLFADVDFIFIIMIYAALIAAENFESSFQINRGNPKYTLWIQCLVLCLSISAIGYINRDIFLCISFAAIYVVLSIKSVKRR